MGLFSSAAQFALQSASKQIINEALQEALSIMSSMPGNNGQRTVYQDHVVPAFKEHAQAPASDGWEDVDIGEYMSFMGEIVEAGNQIMQEAYDFAQEVSAEA